MLVRCVPPFASTVEPANFGCPASQGVLNNRSHIPKTLTAASLDTTGRYLETSLASDVSGFFLISCGTAGRGYRVAPLNSGERIYILRDQDNFPAKMEETIIELRKRGIWVVHSPIRAKRQINQSIQNGEPARFSLLDHPSLVLRSLPNSSDERLKTFETNSSESELCRFVLDSPLLLRRFLTEGIFYSDCKVVATGGGPERGKIMESFTCSFCKRTGFFFLSVSKAKATVCQPTQPNGGVSSQEAKLNRPMIQMATQSGGDMISHSTKNNPLCTPLKLHSVDCPYRHFPDQALVHVSDPDGNAKAIEAYFIVDPICEDISYLKKFKLSHQLCPYTRIFIIDGKKDDNPLIVSREEMAIFIFQEQNHSLYDSLSGTFLTTSNQMARVAQQQQQLLENFRQQYSSSKLCQSIQAYRNLLQYLPGPLTESQQAMVPFLENVSSKLSQLYVLYHQLTTLFSWVEKANTTPMMLDHLNPILHRLASEHQHIVNDLAYYQYVPLSSGHFAMHISHLSTLFSDLLWRENADPRYKEIIEAGNEILAQVHPLYLMDNEQYAVILQNRQVAVSTNGKTRKSRKRPGSGTQGAVMTLQKK